MKKGSDRPARNKERDYIDNEKFFQEVSEWKITVLAARDRKEIDPPITEFMGKCFLDISTRLCFRPNFIGYTFKDDFISDGIENCVLYAHNFNPEKSKNPFSYFTQIIYFAFLRRIEKEKKQRVLKHKLIIESGIIDQYSDVVDSDNQFQIDRHIKYLREYLGEKDSSTKKNKKGPLNLFFE